jgi:site-specific recombinase XerD
MESLVNFPQLLEAFFTDRLMKQRQASQHTIASYSDTFRLLLSFAQRRLKKAPSSLTIEDLDAPFVGAFLEHLEKERGNSARTRNARLAAIHSFFRYAAFYDLNHSALIQRVLAMPSKRHACAPIPFLTRPEIDALLAAPDQKTWAGRRDRALMMLAVQTGLRVSELTGLRCQDVALGRGAHVRCLGKGRKERCTPLRRDVVAALRSWLRDLQSNDPAQPLFPAARGGPLSRDGVAYLLEKYVVVAQEQCASLKNKRVSPHVLRHSAAMDLLEHGVPLAVIALLFGHESMETTQIYAHASMAMKEKALAKTAPLNAPVGHYRPTDRLLTLLRSL